MIVEDLIRMLSSFDPDDVVCVSQPTHNYWHEVEAVTIDFVGKGIVGLDDMVYDSEAAAIENAEGYNTYVVIGG